MANCEVNKLPAIINEEWFRNLHLSGSGLIHSVQAEVAATGDLLVEEEENKLIQRRRNNCLSTSCGAI